MKEILLLTIFIIFTFFERDHTPIYIIGSIVILLYHLQQYHCLHHYIKSLYHPFYVLCMHYAIQAKSDVIKF